MNDAGWHNSFLFIRQMAADVDVVVFATSYGKKWMKQQKISPDGYLQVGQAGRLYISIYLTLYNTIEILTMNQYNWILEADGC